MSWYNRGVTEVSTFFVSDHRPVALRVPTSVTRISETKAAGLCFGEGEMEFENKQGFIYLIDGGNGLYKIGKTVKDPQKRAKDIQAMCPVQIELICFFESDDLDRVERVLHKTLIEQRRHGEWFELSEAQVETFKGIEDRFLDLDYENFLGPMVRYRKLFRQ